MKITVTGRQIELTPADRARIRRNVERLTRPLGDAALSTQVAVARDGTMHVCELTLHVRGDHMLHAKGRDKRVPVAVGQAVTKVAAQAKKLSDRWKSRRKVRGPDVTGGVSVGTLLGAQGASAGLNLDLLAGASGLERRITLPYVQKTGLALAGYDEYLRTGRVLILGESEVRFLQQLESARRAESLRRIFRRDFPCVIVTMGLEAPSELAAEAERSGVPVLRTTLTTPVAIARLTTLLEDKMAPRETRHGVLMDILGLGVLITGDSGIGKSECALDLIGRGHRLVADDTVEVRCRGEAILIGTCPELTRHHVEVRGLGLINVTDLFGVSATRSSKRVELAVHLERWNEQREYDRLGLDVNTIDILGIAVPLVVIPVAPGRSIAMLLEVAARTHLLRSRGRNAARELADRLERRLEQLAERDPDDFEVEEL